MKEIINIIKRVIKVLIKKPSLDLFFNIKLDKKIKNKKNKEALERVNDTYYNK